MTKLDKLFPEPLPVDQLTLAFPADVKRLMPPFVFGDTQDPLYLWGKTEEAQPFLEFQSVWFARGLDASTELHLREGIDPTVALRHLAAVQGTFSCKHEYKRLAVAWLLWRWSAAPPKTVPAPEPDHA